MFGKIREMLDRLSARTAAVLEVVSHTDEVAVRQCNELVEIRTWVELLADTKADAVSEEFELLLEKRLAAKQKLTNKALAELVHQAVLNTAK